MIQRTHILPLLAVLFLPSVLAAKERPSATLHTNMRRAATTFLAALDDELRAQATFPFDGPQRTDWHFVPKDRPGVNFHDMNLSQRRAAHALMQSVLSEKGYFKSLTIMSLETVLREIEADRENVNEIRDSEKYWFAVFGDPSGDEPWGWRVEGHHLSLNFTEVDEKVVAAAPIFFGTNPAEVRVGPRVGLRVLGDEIDQARALLASLSPEQTATVMIAEQAPADVLTVPGAPIEIGKPAGLAAGKMTKPQRAKLRQMVNSFLRHLEPSLAREEIRAVKEAGIDDIHFAWAGSTKPDEKHYFRLHGPTFILEYDNVQGNHAHLVWHTRGNDFGAAVLQRHYEKHEHEVGAAR